LPRIFLFINIDMSPYKILQCPNYQKINKQILEFLRTHTDLLDKTPRLYTNFQDIKLFIKKCPALLEWCIEMGMIPRDVYFSYCGSRGLHFGKFGNSPCPIHLDRPPVNWKMNWPVLNMEGSCVRFFKTLVEGVDPVDLAKEGGIPGSKAETHYSLSYEPFEEMTRHNFSKNEPILMNGSIPHDVGLYDDAKFPRLGIQMMFVKEPTHLL